METQEEQYLLQSSSKDVVSHQQRIQELEEQQALWSEKEGVLRSRIQELEKDRDSTLHRNTELQQKLLTLEEEHTQQSHGLQSKVSHLEEELREQSRKEQALQVCFWNPHMFCFALLGMGNDVSGGTAPCSLCRRRTCSCRRITAPNFLQCASSLMISLTERTICRFAGIPCGIGFLLMSFCCLVLEEC